MLFYALILFIYKRCLLPPLPFNYWEHFRQDDVALSFTYTYSIYKKMKMFLVLCKGVHVVLMPIWRDNNISLGSKVKLMRSLVISIFLYACESWTLTAELEKRTQAFEMRCYRRLLNISYKDHVTNEEVRRKIQAAIGEYDKLLTLVKKRKLRWFGHVSRSSGLAKTILQGTVKGKRKRGRQKKRWEDNIKEWTGMDFASSTRAAENRSRWKGIVANSSVVPRQPSKVMG